MHESPMAWLCLQRWSYVRKWSIDFEISSKNKTFIQQIQTKHMHQYIICTALHRLQSPVIFPTGHFESYNLPTLPVSQPQWTQVETVWKTGFRNKSPTSGLWDFATKWSSKNEIHAISKQMPLQAIGPKRSWINLAYPLRFNNTPLKSYLSNRAQVSLHNQSEHILSLFDLVTCITTFIFIMIRFPFFDSILCDKPCNVISCHMSFCWHFGVMLVGGPAEGCLHPEGDPFFQRNVDVAEPCQLPGVKTSNYPRWKSWIFTPPDLSVKIWKNLWKPMGFP